MKLLKNEEKSLSSKKRQTDSDLYSEFYNKINSCTTENELEKVSDDVDECHMCKLITNKTYNQLEELLDDKLMEIVEKELYGNE